MDDEKRGWWLAAAFIAACLYAGMQRADTAADCDNGDYDACAYLHSSEREYQ